MSEETQLILGDAAVDATTEGRRGLRRRRRRERRGERALTHCENCGAPLTGEYCARCGQHAIDYRRSLWRVLVDAADSFLNWDTKFLSSVGVLLAKPWRLTNDFNAGRRARYVHPLRLYLLGSIVFFLMFKLIKIDDHMIQFGPEDRAEIAGLLGKFVGPDSALTADQQAKLESVRTRLVQGSGEVSEQESDEVQEVVRQALATTMKKKFEPGERARLKLALKNLPEISKPPDAEAIRKNVNEEVARSLSEAGLPTPAVSPGIAGPFPSAAPSTPQPSRSPRLHFSSEDKSKAPFESWMESRIKNKVGEDGTRGKLFLQTLFNNVPTMMLCCVPLFALVLKLLYLGKRRFYVEHLVYALHIHTFVYVAVTLVVLCAMAIAQWSNTARVLFSVACGFAIFLQVFLSIRRVYGQGWFFSGLKFVIGGIIYSVVLFTAVGVTAFVTLLLPD